MTGSSIIVLYEITSQYNACSKFDSKGATYACDLVALLQVIIQFIAKNIDKLVCYDRLPQIIN